MLIFIKFCLENEEVYIFIQKEEHCLFDNFHNYKINFIEVYEFTWFSLFIINSNLVLHYL